jgi:putative hydrolase of the HAD superfamily
MPLLLVDLDNTLIDRDAAFRLAVAGFLREHGLPATDVDWVMAADAGGYASRALVAAAMIGRFGVAEPDVRALLDHGAAGQVTLAAATADALRRIRAAGWTCVIVTNGRTAQQEAKIRNTGLDRLVDGWVVSEAVGCRKPDPAIFRAAAPDLDGAWMIGDSPHADIAGACALGLTSVWVSGGRPWTETVYRPTHTAADVVTALGLLSQPDEGGTGHQICN